VLTSVYWEIEEDGEGRVMIWRESFSICEIIYHLRFFKKLSWRWCKMLVSWSLSLHASWYGTSRTAVRRSIFLL
jgi:hypothetical protein